jgi:inner membrane protein YidH
MNDHFNEMTNAQHEKWRLDPDKIEAEILANERTFLAWVRTSIAVMSLGFVIARFSFWMREMSSSVNPTMRVRPTGISEALGECMIGLGGVLTAFAVFRQPRCDFFAAAYTSERTTA